MQRAKLIALLTTAVLCVVLAATTSLALTELSLAKDHTVVGVKQQLFNADRYAPRHRLSAVVVVAPTEADKARIQANTFVDQHDEGWYKFDIHVNSGASIGDYEIEFYDSERTIPTVCPDRCPLPERLTVHVYEIVVVAISFRLGATSSLPIYDPETDMEIVTPEWWAGFSKPGAYVRDTGPPPPEDERRKQIKVVVHGPKDPEDPNHTIELDATGGWGGIEPKSVTFNAQGVAVDTGFTMHQPVPEQVLPSDVTWQWRYRTTGDPQEINTSSHRIYTVLRDNSAWGNHRYQELYRLGCTWANGETTEPGTVSEIWEDANDLNIVYDEEHGYAYGYWYKTAPSSGPGDPDAGPIEPPSTFDSRSLLLLKYGRCTAWRAFFEDLFGTQGINTDQHTVRPRNEPPTHFTHLTAGAGDHGPLPIPPEPNGPAGQGGTTTYRTFNLHAINSYATEYYDISYGLGPFDSQLLYEDSAIGWFWSNDTLSWTRNPAGSQETDFEAWP